MPTVEQVVAKWQSRASGAGQAWLDGINGVTEAPTAVALRNADKWRQKMMMEETFRKYKEGLSSVTLEAWKKITADKGAGRFTSGIAASVNKYRQVFTQVMNHINSGLGTIRAMPSVTLEDNIARSAAWIRHMATFKRTA
jgi:hypothetical protein